MKKSEVSFGARVVTFLERVPLLVAALVCVIIAVADLAGVSSWSPVLDRTPTITMLAIGLMSMYLLIERQTIIRRSAEQTRALSNKIRDLNEKLANATSFFEALDGERFSEIKFVYGMREYAAAISTDEIAIGSDRTFELWADSLRESSRFLAFNYVDSAQVWATKGWALEIANSLQLSQLKKGCLIRRVFILDDEVEREALKEVMKAQSELGIDVRWAFASELKGVSSIQSAIKEIGTWDFVAIDNDLVFSVDLNRARRMTGARLKKSQKLHDEAERCFLEAYGMGITPE